MVGPIAVVADPQGEFVYAMDINSEIVPYALNAGTGALTAGTPLGGMFEGGATGGVGDPFTIAASGTSPVWEDACTQMIEYFIQAGLNPPAGGCFLPTISSTADGSGGDAGHPPPSAAATRILTVSYDVWGGNIVSTPAGIDYSSENLSQNTFMASFPSGTSVTLHETPASVPAQAYDVKWTGTGGCSGTGISTSVHMTQDQSCHLALSPVSTR